MSVRGRQKVFASLQYKAVSEKDTRSSQHKAASYNFRLPRFVSNVLLVTFCWLVRIKSQRALSEFYGSLNVGLNLSVRKLQWV